MLLKLSCLINAFIVCAFIFPNNSITLKKHITSLLNTTDTYYFDNNLLVSTEGGFYSINSESYNVYNNNLNTYNISNIAEDQWGRIWLTSNSNGSIQILDSNYNLDDFIDYPDFDNIIKIVFTPTHAYSIVLDNQEYFIVHLFLQWGYMQYIVKINFNFRLIKLAFLLF